jgi:hypothetical protein
MAGQHTNRRRIIMPWIWGLFPFWTAIVLWLGVGLTALVGLALARRSV